ncbi:MAG: rod shape-determining protein [Chloroflexi bacterium]|nr:rod shape-determining protein [Chloroflexota bacterium]
MFGLFSKDLGIDLGTANTLVYVRDQGVVISEPSVVAKDLRTGKIFAVGMEAKRMVGRTPASIVAIRPLRDGVISDFEIVHAMLRHWIKVVHDRYLFAPAPRVAIGIPSGATEVEWRAVREAALNSGAREAYLIEEPMASAIGSGLPVSEPAGNMVVDIGGGTTEIAVISLGGIVVNRSIRIAGDEIDEMITQYMRREHNLLIGERMAEQTKIEIGSAYPLPEEKAVVLRGRDLRTGLPASVEVGSKDLRDAIAGPVNAIVTEVKAALEETPPELVADIMDRGIMLAGGGALLQGLSQRLREETLMPVHVAEEPLQCVVRGTGKCLEELSLLEKVSLTQPPPPAPQQL